MREILPEQLFNTYVQQIEQATSYQQVAYHRQAMIKQHVAQQNTLPVISQPPAELIQPSKTEKVVLISLLIGSLLTVGGLIIKLKSKYKTKALS